MSIQCQHEWNYNMLQLDVCLYVVQLSLVKVFIFTCILLAIINRDDQWR